MKSDFISTGDVDVISCWCVYTLIHHSDRVLFVLSLQAIIHPDTGEKVFMPFRMSGKFQMWSLDLLRFFKNSYFRFCSIWHFHCEFLAHNCTCIHIYVVWVRAKGSNHSYVNKAKSCLLFWKLVTFTADRTAMCRLTRIECYGLIVVIVVNWAIVSYYCLWSLPHQNPTAHKWLTKHPQNIPAWPYSHTLGSQHRREDMNLFTWLVGVGGSWYSIKLLHFLLLTSMAFVEYVSVFIFDIWNAVCQAW